MALPRVLLATFGLMPDGEPGGVLVVEALARRGVSAAWARWDDPSVPWERADLVAVRSTWDYQRRLVEFFTWARGLGVPVLNGVGAFEWNHDKRYLLALADDVPVVPSMLLADPRLRAGLSRAVARWGELVVKPTVGAGGTGLLRVTGPEDPELMGLTPGPWLAQPVVESIGTRGESSVVVLDGAVVVQIDKLPAPGELRVHEERGGTSRAVDVDPACRDLALAAVAASERLLGHRLDYARVDLLEIDGALVVGEVELIEPGLYLDLVPELAEPFADLVVARLATR
ncbi:ATP-grasp domain-containing protein [Nocardioides acrostichi]|uniref:ATP-grasp domain-containing protein n=1 Tax=Nocardioides acrostichi TaxID=2784339 RepID=A0A930V0U3_9ACTN|nr:hypothetical protein [Nocardioides acrostichi]MBF4161791.1 hypothetical protein [Nocardioides acrostichi]